MKLKNYLEFNKVNISKMAKSIGITRAALYNIMNETSIPSVYTAINIVNYINKKVEKNGLTDYEIKDFWN